MKLELRSLAENRCPCGGVYEERRVEVRMTSPAGAVTVLSDVPQQACPSCGSRVYWAPVIARLEALHERVVTEEPTHGEQ